MENQQHAPPSSTQNTTGPRGAKIYGVDVPWPPLTSSSTGSTGPMHHQYAPPPIPVPIYAPLAGTTGSAANAAMSQAKRPKAEVSYQPRPCQSFTHSGLSRDEPGTHTAA